MAVAFNTSAVATAGNANSVSLNITTSGTNVGLIATAADDNTGRAFSGVTVDAVSGVQVASTVLFGSKRLVMYRKETNAAGTNNVRVAYGGGTDITLGVNSFTGVLQAGMVGATAVGTGSNTVALKVALDTNGMCVAAFQNSGTAVLSISSNETERINTVNGTVFRVEMCTMPGTSTAVMTVVNNLAASGIGGIAAAITQTALAAQSVIIPQQTVMGNGT